MEQSRAALLPILLMILIVLVLAGLTWVNYSYALHNPGGNDFIPRWLGTRLFIMEGLSPYSEATSQAIQEMVFGRSAHAGEDRSLFVYPFYSLYIFAPFALVADFNMARALWMTVLEVSLILLAVAGLALSRWRIQPVLLVALLVLSVLWYHGVRSVINGNAAILCSLFIAGAFLAIRAGQDGVAGFLLALATIKPQIVILLDIFIILWAISHRRWPLVWSFLGSLALLAATTSLLIPDWIWQNLRQVASYPNYTLPGTPGAIFALWMPGVGSRLGWALTILLAGVLIFEWRLAWAKGFEWFLWTACLTLTITNLIGIRTATDNFLALLPAMILVLATWDQDWGLFGRGLVILSLIGMFFGLWWLFLSTIYELNGQVTQGPVMFFPVPVFTLVGLYWIRWWYLRPPRPLLDQFRRPPGRNAG